jgi:hypothetical protein
VRVIERICDIFPENPASYVVWRELALTLEVKGVQVHDARLAAWMKTQAITHIITLNAEDFSRYPGIIAQTPDELIAKTG